MKNKTKNLSIRIVVALATLSGAACSNSGLEGSGAQYTAGDSAKVAPRDPPTDPKAGQIGDSGQKKSETSQDQADEEGDAKRSNDPALNALLACLKKRSMNYNIVVVLDNSSSQKNTDPKRVRRDVSRSFVERFNNLVARKPDTVARIAIIGFAAKATTSPSWIQLDGKSDTTLSDEPIDRLLTDIDTETSNQTVGTSYKAAFEAAGNQLSSLGTDRFQTDTRNYVLFMTDGRPTEDYTPDSIQKNIVTPNKAAVIAIASGKSISTDDESVVKARALPLTGDPKGAYYRAATPEALKDAWDKIFVDLGGCN